MPEEEIIACGKFALALHSLVGTNVVRLSKTLAMKLWTTVLASEGETMKYVATKFPRVRLPQVHRCLSIENSSPYFGVEGYIVMEYMESPYLDTCWDELSLDSQQSVVEQIATMVDQLQSVHCEYPGVIDGGISRGMWFSDYEAGPFRMKDIFQQWITWKLNMSKRYTQASQDALPLQCPYFVLVHGSISPRNLILDTSNQV